MFKHLSRRAEGGSYGPTPADVENVRIEKYLGWTWVSIIFVILVYRIVISSMRYVRRLVSVGHDKQRLFAETNSTYAWFKRHVLYAPLFRTRHHREFRLSSAMNVGTLPSRLQTFFLVGYFGLNIALSVVHLPWSGSMSDIAGDLRNRTGILAVMNMMPLFLLAGRNNPLIWMLDISYDTFNLIHRYTGRIVVLQIITHTLAWTVNEVHEKGWSTVFASMSKSPLIMTGSVGFFASLALLLQSNSILRHAFYETFLHIHFLLAVTITVAVWMHLNSLPQQILLAGAIAIYSFERAFRLLNILRTNIGPRPTQALITPLPGDALRVTLHLARPWTFRPGQHIYLYLPSIGWWTSHPFSLAWSDAEPDVSEKALPYVSSDPLSRTRTTMSLIIRRRTGMTEKLYQRASLSASGSLLTTALVEGPYGSQTLDSYGTVVLFAAGVGITHQVPFVRSLVTGYTNATTATRKVTLVWIIQSPEHLEWIRPWMTQILGMERRREVLKIMLFITRPRSFKEIHSPSSSVQMYPGKPNVEALVDGEVKGQVGAMAVSVCGTGSLSDDVRRAVRERVTGSEIDFVENAFSW